MTDNEVAFLRDLNMLFRKYSIDKCAIKENKIIFISNDNTFSFFGYANGTFHEIVTSTMKFTPFYGERDEAKS